MTASNVLRKLIRACPDDGRTLRHEAEYVNAACAEPLMRLGRERAPFAMGLERVAKREQPHDGSWRELSGRNNRDAITSRRHSRARTEAL
jgi:hypothetical protein